MYFHAREEWVEGSLWVWITLTSQVVEEGTFDDLLRLWVSYYDRRISFTFVFETKDVTRLPNPWLCIRMALFIREIKQRSHQYVTTSHIMIHNMGLLRMLEFIFAIQSPVAPVKIYLREECWNDALSPDRCILPT